MAQQTDGNKMKSTQTAVDFLYEFVQMELNHEQQMRYEGLFQQAKKMEKEQIIKAYHDDNFPCSHYGAEQYYNETYGNEGI